MSKKTPEEVLELVKYLKESGFEVKNDGERGLITVKGQLKLMYKNGNSLHIEVEYNDLEIDYIEEGDKTVITLLKFEKMIKETDEEKVKEYSVLKLMEFNRKFEVWVDGDTFGIRY